MTTVATVTTAKTAATVTTAVIAATATTVVIAVAVITVTTATTATTVIAVTLATIATTAPTATTVTTAITVVTVKPATTVTDVTIRLNGVAFSVIFDGDNVRMKSHHPYDDAEYHYAISKDGGEQFSIYRDRKFVEQFAPFSFDEDEESGIRNFNWNEVARELLRLDKNVEARMMYD